jgi:hypothetical protein
VAEDEDVDKHHELQPRVRAKAPVDLEVSPSRALPLLFGREAHEQLDHRVAFRDPVPGGGEREEDGDDRVGGLVTVGRDRMKDRGA